MEINRNDCSFLKNYPLKWSREISHADPDHKLLIKALRLIEDNFRSHREGLFYISELCFTRHQVNKLLRFYTGKTLYQLVQQRIHREAKYLLAYTCIEIKTITFELGLDDPSYFTKSFIRIEGVSPKEYRKQKHAAYTQVTLNSTGNQH